MVLPPCHFIRSQAEYLTRIRCDHKVHRCTMNTAYCNSQYIFFDSVLRIGCVIICFYFRLVFFGFLCNIHRLVWGSACVCYFFLRVQ